MQNPYEMDCKTILEPNISNIVKRKSELLNNNKTKINKISTDNISTDNISTDNISTDNISSDNISTDNISSVDKICKIYKRCRITDNNVNEANNVGKMRSLVQSAQSHNVSSIAYPIASPFQSSLRALKKITPKILSKPKKSSKPKISEQHALAWDNTPINDSEWY
jgi:hypothetical protein